MKFLAILVLVLGLASMCDGSSSSGDSAYDSCVAAEIERYENDPYYEYEGNEDMYAGIAEGVCQ